MATEAAKKTVKVSYSILNNVARGYIDDAIAYYLGKKVPETEAMKLGKVKHQQWELEIKDNGRIPDELGGGKLNKPLVEHFVEEYLPFSEKYDLFIRGKIDTLDPLSDPIHEGGKRCYDWKTGTGNPATYVDTMQMDIYALLDPTIEEAVYKCWNPYSKEVTTGVKFIYPQNTRDALNWIMTYAGIFIESLEYEGLVKDYKNPKESPASHKQLEFVTDLGGKVFEGMTSAQASEQIDTLLKQRKAKA